MFEIMPVLILALIVGAWVGYNRLTKRGGGITLPTTGSFKGPSGKMLLILLMSVCFIIGLVMFLNSYQDISTNLDETHGEGATILTIAATVAAILVLAGSIASKGFRQSIIPISAVGGIVLVIIASTKVMDADAECIGTKRSFFGTTQTDQWRTMTVCRGQEAFNFRTDGSSPYVEVKFFDEALAGKFQPNDFVVIQPTPGYRDDMTVTVDHQGLANAGLHKVSFWVRLAPVPE